MEKVIIGEILNKRISELGYTQQEFADLMGMKIDTLRSYMNGRSAYSYELLIEFAEKLNCSYDYLLGYSKSPKREYHEITEQTRLSEEALSKLFKYAKYYDDEFEARRYIKSLDLLICENNAFNAICDFFVASKPLNSMMDIMLKIFQGGINNNEIIKKLGIEADRALSLETQQMIYIISQLMKLKSSISPEFIDEIKKLEPVEDTKKRNEFIAELVCCKETQNALTNFLTLLEKYEYINDIDAKG